jgi:hypothetical protein
MASLNGDLLRKTEEARLLREEVAAKKRLEILLQDMREKLHHLGHFFFTIWSFCLFC